MQNHWFLLIFAKYLITQITSASLLYWPIHKIAIDRLTDIKIIPRKKNAEIYISEHQEYRNHKIPRHKLIMNFRVCIFEIKTIFYSYRDNNTARHSRTLLSLRERFNIDGSTFSRFAYMAAYIHPPVLFTRWYLAVRSSFDRRGRKKKKGKRNLRST